jgi:hypothetical protein
MRAGHADLCRQLPVSASEWVNADVYQDLLRQHVVPLAYTTYPDGNTSSGGFSTGPHCQDYLAVLGGILNFGGMATIFAGFEFGGLLYLECFQA